MTRTDGDEVLDRCELLAAELGMPTYAAVVDAHRACCALRRGDTDEARTLVEDAHAKWAESDGTYPFRWCGLLVELALGPKPSRARVTAQELNDAGQQLLPAPIPELLVALEEDPSDDAVAAVVDAARSARLV